MAAAAPKTVVVDEKPVEAAPAEPEVAATAADVASDETARKLEELQEKTKAGFGKVKEDLKKQNTSLESLNESIDKRFAELQPGGGVQDKDLEAVKESVASLKLSLSADMSAATAKV